MRVCKIQLQNLAQEAKDEANKLFKEKHYAAAVDGYTKAIDFFPTAIYYGARALAILLRDLPPLQRIRPKFTPSNSQTYRARPIWRGMPRYRFFSHIRSLRLYAAGNRAFAHIRLENYGAAVADADKALDLDPKYIKGYYRRADANFMLTRFKDAVKDFR